MEQVETLAREIAARHGLGCAHDYSEIFLACTNDPDATAVLEAGIHHEPQALPLLGPEDFGRFGLEGAKSAMVFFGSGLD